MNVDLVTELIVTNRKRIGRKTDKEVSIAVAKYNCTALPGYQITNMQVHKKLTRYYNNEKKKLLIRSRVPDPRDDPNPLPLFTLPTPQPGRPKGSTIKEKNHRDNVASHFKDIITVLYKSFVDAKALQQELQSVEGQSTEDAEGMPIDHTVIMVRRLLQEDVSLTEAYKRIYDRVYLTYNEKYGFMEEKEYSCFSYEAVLSRIRRGRMEHVHPGQHTPAAELEPLVAQLCIRASQSNNSLSQREVVDLMNSVLKGSQCEKTIIQWKLKHCKTMRGVAITKLGDSWFRGFIKRFPELKIAKQSDVIMNQDSWCTYHNLCDMYDILF